MQAKPPPTLRAIRIVVVGLTLGMIAMAALFAALHATGMRTPGALPVLPVPPRGPPAPAAAPAPLFGQPDLMLFVLGALAFGVAAMLVIVPRQLTIQGAKRYQQAQTDDEREAVFLNAISSLTITRCSMVEGLGLFGAVIFLLNGQWPLILVPAFAALVLIAFYPTDAKAAAYRESLERTGAEDLRTGRAPR